MSEGERSLKGDLIVTPINKDVKAKFSITPEIKENINRINETSTLDNLKRFLNPLDYSRFRATVADHLPHSATTWLADNIGNPFWMQENRPEAKPFYEEGKEREVNRLSDNIRMFGGLIDKEGVGLSNVCPTICRWLVQVFEFNAV